MLSSQGDAVKLYLDSRTYVAGDRVAGTVELDCDNAIKDGITSIRVKLRGVAKTEIQHSTGTTALIYQSKSALVRDDIELWQQSSSPANTNTITLPFEFHLPNDTPGSFRARRSDRHGIISYGVEVVAERPGLLKRKRRVGQMIPVLSLASKEYTSYIPQLREGWANGDWKTHDETTMIRKRLWGDHSEVKAHIKLPALESFPVGIPIPVSIVITTITKAMSKGDVSSDEVSGSTPGHKPLFPAPPTTSDQVKFHVRAITSIEAQGVNSTIKDDLASLFEGDRATNVHIKQEEPEWIPQSEKASDKGQWKRQVRFDSVITLKCAPTFGVPKLSCQHELVVEVPFPGVRNKLELKVPIQVNSGVSEFNPDAPPRASLDLPPEYFAGEDHDWDVDEKSG